MNRSGEAAWLRVANHRLAVPPAAGAAVPETIPQASFG